MRRKKRKARRHSDDRIRLRLTITPFMRGKLIGVASKEGTSLSEAVEILMGPGLSNMRRDLA
jgi:hypothetical protein